MQKAASRAEPVHDQVVTAAADVLWQFETVVAVMVRIAASRWPFYLNRDQPLRRIFLNRTDANISPLRPGPRRSAGPCRVRDIVVISAPYDGTATNWCWGFRSAQAVE